MITAYVTFSDRILELISSRAGSPGLDENKDFFYVIASPYDSITFHNKIEDAVKYAMKMEYTSVYIAKIEDDECIKALNNSIDTNTDDLTFMIKKFIKIED